MSKSMVDISTAATLMGISPKAVRNRLGRGTLEGTKHDGRWYVALSQSNPTVQRVGQDKPNNRRLIQSLTEELDAFRREVQDLRVRVRLLTIQAEAPRAYRAGWFPPR